jgi:transcriptional regulator with XRE-family HTH domain
MDIYKEIGETIRLRRKKFGLTQDALAVRVNVSRASLANIESGRQRLLIHVLYEIALELHMDPKDLLPAAPSLQEEKTSSGPVKLPQKGLKKSQRDQIQDLFSDDFRDIH